MVHGLTVKAADSSRRQVSIPTRYFVELSRKSSKSRTPMLFGKELSHNPGPGSYERSLDSSPPPVRRNRNATFFLRKEKRFATSPQNQMLGPGCYDPAQNTPPRLGAIFREHHRPLPSRLS